MIQAEGYKAFRGTMRITPKNPMFHQIEIYGDWLYKPEYNCWYGNGQSYMAEVCQVVLDESQEPKITKGQGGIESMEENNAKIKIGFSFTNEFGCHYTAESETNIFEDLSEFDFIGSQFDKFLGQIGYSRNGDTVFMESITEEEAEMLHDALRSYRTNNTKEASNNG